jgi:CheY-like chemotaxis protein
MVTANGGGTLKLHTEVGLSTYQATTATTAPMIRIAIQDDGPGISPDYIVRIFDPFFTTKPEGEGSGLGLSICHGIISEHDGYIWAESEPGQGATFIIELPIISPSNEKKQAKATPSAKASATAPGRVMLIDDETSLSEAIAIILRRNGYIVDAVDNGLHALELLSKFSYDFILCDIYMPGINGLKFYRRVQREYPRMVDKIVFTTGDTVSRSIRHFLDETGAACLIKPFEMNELVQLVRTSIAEKKPR